MSQRKNMVLPCPSIFEAIGRRSGSRACRMLNRSCKWGVISFGDVWLFLTLCCSPSTGSSVSRSGSSLVFNRPTRAFPSFTSRSPSEKSTLLLSILSTTSFYTIMVHANDTSRDESDLAAKQRVSLADPAACVSVTLTTAFFLP
jgi:hypothetical protein